MEEAKAWCNEKKKIAKERKKRQKGKKFEQT